jgi:chitinase
MAGRWRSILALCLLVSCVFPIFPAASSETVIYTYDDRGRLVQVSRSGSVNDGIQASYTYDKADNRTNVAVTGPGFSVNDVSVTEGGTLQFTVTRTSSGAAASVGYATSNGTAVAPGDYTAVSGSLSFAIGETSKPVNVTTVDDAASEGAEALNLTLSNPVGAAIIDGAGVGTINDNDGPPPCNGIGFSVNDVRVLEGDALVFTITKSGTATGSCSVSYATANGTAVSPGDYAAVSGTLTFGQNETSKTVSTTTVIAGPNESTEIMYLNLSSPTSGATLTDGQGIGTIDNNFDGCLTCLNSEPPPEES